MNVHSILKMQEFLSISERYLIFTLIYSTTQKASVKTKSHFNIFLVIVTFIECDLRQDQYEKMQSMIKPAPKKGKK